MQIPEHLRALEEQLLQPEVRKDPELLALLIADDFQEFGSSGRTYDKPAILEAMKYEPPHTPALLSQFAARSLVEGIVLVTYRTLDTTLQASQSPPPSEAPSGSTATAGGRSFSTRAPGCHSVAHSERWRQSSPRYYKTFTQIGPIYPHT